MLCIRNIINLIFIDTILKGLWLIFHLQHFNNFQQREMKLKIKNNLLSNVDSAGNFLFDNLEKVLPLYKL